ncbi:hypothetical protein POTOM_039672 [Populus tomentosa]|nr:hypothetical protein POTOM_039672 [Populus tomentosa]
MMEVSFETLLSPRKEALLFPQVSIYVNLVNLCYHYLYAYTIICLWCLLWRLEELQVLDIKFPYGCSKPTIGVLFQSITKADERVDADGSRYLLGDLVGLLHLLVITHEKENQHCQDFLKLVHICATGLKIELLGETSTASTIISYLDNAFVFIGSSYGDSQHEEGGVEERARDYNAIWMSTVEILDGDIYLDAENNFNLFTVRKNSEGAAKEE